MTVADLTAAMKRWQQVPGFVAGLKHALGHAADAELSDELPVLAFLFRPVGDDVISAYVLTAPALVIFELAKTGATMAITVPLYRLRRVSEWTIDAETRLRIEIDADRTVIRPAPELGDGVATMTPSGYELVAAAPDEADRIRQFGAAVRAALLLG